MIGNIEAEKSILSCLIGHTDTEVKEDIFLELGQNDFTIDSHKKIFQSCYLLFKSNKPIDIITVIELGNDVSEVSNLAICEPTNANYKAHIDILLKARYSRQILEIAKKITEVGGKDPYKARDFALSELADIGEKSNSELTLFKETIDDVANDILQAVLGEKKANDYIKAPFQKLNYMLHGFQSGEICIVAARPGVGKSAFVSEIILHATLQQKKSVAFFNLEMSKKQIANRMYANLLNKSLYEIEKGKVEQQAVITANSRLRDSSLYVDVTNNTIERIMRACRVLKKRKGLDLVVIDYLQLVTSANEKLKDRRAEVEYVSRNLKLLAMELNIPIIALSQMSRAIEIRGRNGEDDEPMLSDLRETGAIEQDATSVIFLHRNKKIEKSKNYREDIDRFLMLSLAKNRNGAVGKMYIKFEADKMKFYEADKNGDLLDDFVPFE
jgi:replicative DNA helicase